MTRTSIRTLITALSLAVLATDLTGQDLVLTGGFVVDPATRTVVRQDLWIRDGRIAGRGEQVPPSAPGERIAVDGRYIIPGLNDAHTHSFGNVAPTGAMDGNGPLATARRVTRAGVTSFLDLFSLEDFILPLRDRVTDGAMIFAAGPCFTATGGHCSEYGIPTRIIDTPHQARAQLTELLPKGPDVVKVVYDHAPNRLPSIDRPTLEALLAGAAEKGVATVVHIGTWDDIRDATMAGATAVTHVPTVGELPPDLPAEMARRGVYHIPTLAVQSDLAMYLAAPAMLDDPLLVAVTSDSIRAAYQADESILPARAQRWIAGQRESRPQLLEWVRTLHDAGVVMLTGTDGGNWGVFQGYSVHRELALLVEAGLTNWEALSAATTNVGAFLGQDFGVSPGDVANLVVLDASPIDDIGNTRGIRLVVVRGRPVYGM